MCPSLSDETKDWVYEKLLSGTPAQTIIYGTMFSCTICRSLTANAVAAGRQNRHTMSEHGPHHIPRMTQSAHPKRLG
jgi:hypothetical protein